ncbi:cell surface glycolipoprotein Mpt83 [Arthrobacter tecti]
MELFKRRNLSVLGVAAVAMFGLAACGGGDEAATDTETTESTTTETTEAMTDEPTEEMTDEGMDPAALVGPGCADYAEMVPDGAGSVDGMAQDPVATAASNNPLLTQLTAAVSAELNPEVDLVDTLNTAEALTVFAPVDEAFEALDEATVESLSTDADLLSGILTYHVVEGQLAPDEVAGTHTTLNGAELTVEGEGDSITVGADSAAVICGGVQTANATVYLIDSILMPPSE